MKQIEILATAPLMPSVMEALGDSYVVHRLWEAAERAALFAEHGSRIRAIATNGSIGADAALLDQLPALEIISCFGVGVDAIDLAGAARRGIAVTTTPGVLVDDVADQALALLLAVSRKIVAADRHVREGKWARSELVLTRRVSGKKAGILGLGDIGKALAERLAALGMSISYCNRSVAAVPYRFVADLEALAADSDFLIITASGAASTRNLVNASVLDALGPQGFLVNVARGSIIDEPALISALQNGRIAGAGLDVFWDEPNPSPAFSALDNVVLAPHAASGTVETRAAMGQLVIDNLAAHFSGKPLLTPYPDGRSQIAS
jgi:lactate dehydrogenase-like 2-hydroxyacid dehydrogenase